MTALVITFIVTLLTGMPIAFVLGITALVTLLFTPNMPLAILPQKMFSGVDFFSLIAVPFFILAGELMNRGRITDSIVDFSQQLVGRLRGGLAHVNIVASMFFAGITGAAVADTSAMGSILIPAMEKEKYPKSFAAAVTAASSVMGPIIPPSLIMIVYALVEGGVSIGALFMAGFIPGVAIGLFQMITAYVIALRRNYPRYDKPFNWPEFGRVTKRAVLPLLTPVIIMGGILGGVFTPTEAAAVADLYALIIGFLVLRTLKFSDLPAIFLRTCVTTSTVFLIFCMGKVLVVLVTINQIPQQLSEVLIAISSSPAVFLLLINVILLVIGCFMEVGVAIIILVPILSPIAASFGIDPLHFAMIVVVNLCIGLITPPLGVVLFVACGIANLSMEKITRDILPFVFAVLLVLIMVTYWPAFTLTIPRLTGLAF
jgi:tripartite ATP-independent transporter DctM subunit